MTVRVTLLWLGLGLMSVLSQTQEAPSNSENSVPATSTPSAADASPAAAETPAAPPAANEQKLAETRLQTLLTEAFDEKAVYTKEEIQPKIRQAEELKLLLPARVQDIDQYLAPWKETLARLQVGQIKFEGQWRTPEQLRNLLERREDETITTWLKENFKPTLRADLVSQKTVLIIAGIIGLMLIFLLEGVLLTWKRYREKDAEAGRFYFIVTFVTGAALAGYLIAMTLEPVDFPKTTTPDSPADVENQAKIVARLIRRSYEPNHGFLRNGERQFQLRQRDLNALLQQSVKITPLATSSPWMVERIALSVQLGAHYFTLFEEGSLQGFPLIVSYQIPHEVTPEGILLQGCSVRIGRAPLPGFLAQLIWKPTEPQLGQILMSSKVLKEYQLKKVEDGRIQLLFINTIQRSSSSADP